MFLFILSLISRTPSSKQVSFRVLDPNGKPFQPEQAFLRLTSAASGKAAFFAAASKAENKLEIVATSSGIEDQLGTQGGEFEAFVILGSASPEAAVEWSIGTVVASHRPAPDGNQPPAPKTKLQTLVEAKPEIVHAHRQPEKRASPVVSLAFALVTLTPLAAFVLGAFNIGANFKVRTYRLILCKYDLFSGASIFYLIIYIFYSH